MFRARRLLTDYSKRVSLLLGSESQGEHSLATNVHGGAGSPTQKNTTVILLQSCKKIKGQR